MKKLLYLVLFFLLPLGAAAQRADAPYKSSKEYLALRDSMHNAFNNGDSARFFVAVAKLQDYLLQQNDLHAYYTQRCNEIVFLLNRERVFEAYKLAQQLSKELTEKKLDSEMYMAVNMMGHIYRYCGNKETAKRCFWEVIRRMEQEGYSESLPPIYLNIVNITMNENPDEALRLIDQALSIAKESSPERVFDIEARRTLAYYTMGDTQRFLDGYKAYKDSVAKGLTSVHGRKLEVYYLASQGRIDEAVALAKGSTDDPYETQAEILSKAGRWEEAYEALKLGAAESDSINGTILSNSMQGIRDELQLYESQREVEKIWLYALITVAVLLALLVIALVYIVQSRRRHLRELKVAYQRVVESDKMKTDFIQNVSHEVRTPLNVISGFAQVLANPDYDLSADERSNIADTMMHKTDIITKMINEVLEMSVSDNVIQDADLTDIRCNEILKDILADCRRNTGRTEQTLRFVSSLDDDFTIRSQKMLLQRILNPLLDNAIKNSPEGDVTLSADVRQKKLVIGVEDKGKGIPKTEAEHIFERFAKLDSFKEGLGLGLPFSRNVARRLGGDVCLDTSFEGPGARFEVTIPIK